MTADGRSRLVRLRETDLTLADGADDVRDRRVVDENGDEIGSVDDLVIDLDERRVRFLLVGARGFLGLGEKQDVIPADAISSVDDEVHIGNRADVSGASAYDPDLIDDLGYEPGPCAYHRFPPIWGPGQAHPRLVRRRRR